MGSGSSKSLASDLIVIEGRVSSQGNQESHSIRDAQTNCDAISLDDYEDEATVIQNEIDEDVNLSSDKILEKIDNDLKLLNGLEEPWEKTGRKILIRLMLRFYNTQTKPILAMVADLMIKNGFLDVYVRIWEFSHNTEVEQYNYLDSVAYNTIKIVYWNYSDASINLAKATFEHKKVVRCCMKEFTMPEFAVSNLGHKKQRNLIKATLAILLNVVRLYNSNSQIIRENNGVKKLVAYYESTYLIIKANVMILLSYCINEEENDKIVTGTGVIEFILKLLKEALVSPNHVATKHHFSATETVMGLDKLAFNDNNKKSMVESGILVHLKKMLSDDGTTPEEHNAAAHCLWTLSFHPQNKKIIQQESGLLEAVHKIRNDTTTSLILRSCDGILLNIEGPKVSAGAGVENTGKHIMISYQWDVQTTMLEIRNKLREKGFDVWMDVYRIKGSILADMADGVENSSVIIVAMTERYKNSNPCRQEAEYAFARSKPIVPLLLQPNYKPDGWLGILLGVQLYVDFSKQEIPLDRKNVKQMLKVVKSKIPSQLMGASVTDVDAPKIKHTKPSGSCSNWTSEEVTNWVVKLGIGVNLPCFAKFDGKTLSQLGQLLRRSPDIYYNSLKNDLNFDLYQLLCFTDALEKLKDL